jgi:transcription-repair coupling factor (superfamily II helicase)
VAETAGHRESLIDKLKTYKLGLKPVKNWQGFLQTEQALSILVAPMDHGLLLESQAIAVITESQA